FQALAAGMSINHLAILPHQDHARDAKNAVLGYGRMLTVVLLVVKNRPRELFRLQELLQIVAVLIDAQTDDFKALIVVLLVHLFHVGNLSNAWPAPGRPEVD